MPIFYKEMSVQSDLHAAIDAYIQENFAGSLSDISAHQRPLENLLYMQMAIALSQSTSYRFLVMFERGRATFVDATTYHDCCEFLTASEGQQNFTPVTVADALEVVSTSTSDTSNGIGTHTVGVLYLDADGVWSETTVTMNGTTAVPLTGITATAIISMSAKTGGSFLTSVGNINLRKVGTPTTIYEQISANSNQSQSGRFTVPTGYMAIFDDLHVSAQGQSVELKLRTTRNQFDGSTVDRYLFKSGIKLAAGDSIVLPLTGQILSAGQSLKISAIADATSGFPRIHGVLDMELVKV